jgi:ATP phosphoribosyltransferase regulatory subunit
MARWLLPEGISDVLPPEAARLEELRRALLDLYRSFGYQLVMPPLVEYVESLQTGAGQDLDLRTFKLVDQMSGRLMGLRADTTPQVARIDAHILNRGGVTRLCYAGSVLHARPLHALAVREPFQVGAELYGHAGREADAEVLALAVASLRTAGVDRVHLDLGHTGVLRALLAADARGAEAADEIVAALSARDGAALDAATRACEAAARAGLLALTRLHGDAGTIDAARRALAAHPAALRALDDLEWLAARCGADRVSVDLSDLHGYRYHTGVTFAAYGTASRAALLRGGRYDDIGRAFGRARPATGFSIDLRELTRMSVATPIAAILAPAGEDAALDAEIDRLRRAGEVVVRRLDGGAPPEGYAFERELRAIDGRWQVALRVPE